jgi:hypothetical protein
MNLAEIKKSLEKDPIPLYFNFIGCREDLLDRAIKSIPKNICDVRVQRWDSPQPFTKCLNKILNECEKERFLFMHYDAEIINESIILELEHEWRTQAVLKENPYWQHRKNLWGIDELAFIAATSIPDLLTLYNVELMKDLGGWDEGLNNSYMDLDLCERLNVLEIPHLFLHRGKDEIEGVLHHKETASQLRNPDHPDNIAAVYDTTYPRDFEYFWSKWPLSPEDDWSKYRWELHCMRVNHGETKDVFSNVNLVKKRMLLAKLRKNWEEVLGIRKERKLMSMRMEAKTGRDQNDDLALDFLMRFVKEKEGEIEDDQALKIALEQLGHIWLY